MLSLVLSTCLMGQPCTEKVIADFYTVMAENMCETNRDGLQMDANKTNIPGRTATFSCKNISKDSPLVRDVINNALILLVDRDKNQEKVTMARYYGKVSAPLCGRNREYYEPVMRESLRLAHASGTIYCL